MGWAVAAAAAAALTVLLSLTSLVYFLPTSKTEMEIWRI
jgi:hypothetical protein